MSRRGESNTIYQIKEPISPILPPRGVVSSRIGRSHERGGTRGGGKDRISSEGKRKLQKMGDLGADENSRQHLGGPGSGADGMVKVEKSGGVGREDHVIFGGGGCEAPGLFGGPKAHLAPNPRDKRPERKGGPALLTTRAGGRRRKRGGRKEEGLLVPP